MTRGAETNGREAEQNRHRASEADVAVVCIRIKNKTDFVCANDVKTEPEK
jgi:hypothetical protein